jgi:predicted DCC family thiol-disulfide oxidoreductase YuxK
MADDLHAGERPSGALGERRWARWAILYDADCGFCTWLLSVVMRRDAAGRLHPIALQRPEAKDLLSPLTSAGADSLLAPDLAERRARQCRRF